MSIFRNTMPQDPLPCCIDCITGTTVKRQKGSPQSCGDPFKNVLLRYISSFSLLQEYILRSSAPTSSN